MLKKAVKRTICIFLALTVMLLANGVVFAAQPENAKLKVIDISKWNNNIDWKKVSLSVDGVIARIGYRGSVYRDRIAEDDLFYSHYQGASKYGIPFGCYFYSLAVTVNQAVEEAEWIISTLKKYNCKPDMPIYIDMEDLIVENEITDRKRTDIANAFCKTLIDNGYYPGVYANRYWLTDLLYPSEFSEYSIWVAQYADECTYEGKYDMWQYTETGTVNGISGKVDINHCYKDYSTFIKKYGFNGYEGTADPEPDKPDEPDSEVVADSTRFGMYKITTTSMNVREKPGTEFSSVGTVKENTEIYVFDYYDGWGGIQFGNSIGWIYLNPNYLVKTLNHNSLQKGIGFYNITADTLNVRSGPSTTYDRVDKLYAGERVYLSSVKNGWGSFYYGDGLIGWVTLEYADFIGTVNFMANGSAGSMNHQLIPTGTTQNLAKNTYTFENKIFSGWATSPTATVKYADGASLKMGDTNIVLYATFKSGEFFTWKNGAAVKNGVVTVPDFKIKDTDFSSKYLNILSGTATYQTVFKGVIGTGAKVTLSDGSLSQTFTVCIKGDINGDSLCDGLDLSMVAELVHGTKKDFSAVQLTAMDMNSDGKQNAEDIAEFKNIVFK